MKNAVALYLLEAYANDIMGLAREVSEQWELVHYGEEMKVISSVIEGLDGCLPEEEFAGEGRGALVAHLTKSPFSHDTWYGYRFSQELFGKQLPKDYAAVHLAAQQKHTKWFEENSGPAPELSG